MSNYMDLAIKLAEKGRGKVEPNPVVGAVIIKNGKIIGKGYHKKFGENHAEINAIENAGSKAKNAEMFVTLEPCNHQGKTGPCTKAIIKSGIKKVHIGILDPNKKSKSGIKELKKHKIEIIVGERKKEIKKQLNCYITNIGLPQRPHITIKIALTTQGIISFGDGKSKKISGTASFMFTQELRRNNDCVLIGVNTVLKDNPKLTVRTGGKTPIRAILDSNAKTPINSQMFSEKGVTLIFCSANAPLKRVNALAKKAVVVIVNKSKSGVNLKEVFESLTLIGVNNVLVEGGNKLNSSLLEQGLFDKLLLIVANKKISRGLKAFNLKKKRNVNIIRTKKIGKDLLIETERIA